MLIHEVLKNDILVKNGFNVIYLRISKSSVRYEPKSDIYELFKNDKVLKIGVLRVIRELHRDIKVLNSTLVAATYDCLTYDAVTMGDLKTQHCYRNLLSGRYDHL